MESPALYVLAVPHLHFHLSPHSHRLGRNGKRWPSRPKSILAMLCAIFADTPAVVLVLATPVVVGAVAFAVRARRARDAAIGRTAALEARLGEQQSTTARKEGLLR